MIDYRASGKRGSLLLCVEEVTLIVMYKRRRSPGVLKCGSLKGLYFHFLILQIEELRPRNNLNDHCIISGSPETIA